AGAPSADRRSRRHHAGGARLRRRVGGPHRPADRDQPTADPLPLPQPRGTDRGRPRSHLRGRLRGGPAEHRPGGHRAGTAGGVHHRQRRLLSGASRLHPRARGDRARHPRRRLATGSSPGGSRDRRARHRPSRRAGGRRARLLRRHRHGPHRPPRAQRSARRLAPGPRARPRPLHRRAAAAVPGRDHEGRGHMMMSVDRAERTTTGNRKAAWSLVVITPLAAELTFGSTPLRMAYLVLLWVPIYGAGVLLIRELVRRAGRGWPSILLLGIAYGMLEDGIGLQALTSPRLYDAAEWGMRVGGVNLAYWEATAIYHTVFSVAIPIALTELLFSSHGRRPYLRTGGLVLTATVTALGVAVLRFTVPVAQDPGYQAPLPFVLAVVVAVLVLGVVALRLLPRTGGRPTTRSVARPAWWYLGSFVAVLAFLALSHPMFGAEQPAFTRGDTVAIPMAAVVLLTVGAV